LITDYLRHTCNQYEARQFLTARKEAPTRAHPAAPQTGGLAQKAADMQAKVQDSLVNYLRGVDYVELKVNALMLGFH
jgi:hypothetical protein